MIDSKYKIEPNTIVMAMNDKAKSFDRFCDHIDILNGIYKDNATFPAFQGGYDKQQKLIAFSYSYLTGSPRLIKFGQFYLDVDGGWITINDSPDAIVLDNLYVYMDNTALGTDIDEFKNRLESYYLGNIDFKEIFTDLPALGYRDVGKLGDESQYSNLFKLFFFSYSTQANSKVDVEQFDLDDFYKFLDRCLRAYELTRHFFRNSRNYLEISGIDTIKDDKDHIQSADIVPDDPRFVEFLGTNVDKASNQGAKSFSVQDHIDRFMTIDGVDEVKSKSEKNFMRLLPLLKVSKDDEARVITSLVGEKQDIIDTVKSSKLAGIVKGAFLKGVITKAENLIDMGTKSFSKKNFNIPDIKTNLLKRWAYAYMFFNKILKNRM